MKRLSSLSATGVAADHAGRQQREGDAPCHDREDSMSVLVTTVIPGLDAATYDQIVGQIGPTLTTSPGFRTHTASDSPAGWTVTEVWDSAPQFHAFYDANVKPNLPPDVAPQVVELHNAIV
jgi:hypothetical protein